MDRALRSELGARAMYGLLARRVRDGELAQVLARFREDEAAQVEALREVMRGLGGRPRSRSARRRVLAILLYLATHLGALGLALRLCLESEETLSRWYAGYADHLAAGGQRAAASACQALSLVKRRHAQALQAWVPR